MRNLTNKKKKSVFSSFLILIFLPSLVFLLAVLAYLNILQLTMPLHTIIMCGVLLLFAMFFAPQNEYCVHAKIKKNSDIFESDLKDYIKENSLKIDEVSKANASFDEFFDIYLHKLKPLSFGYIASAVFPMLGILGTFISIAISMPNFKVENSFALEGEITLLLGGIATAFYVSIYGIFLTIWWMFYSRLGLAKINDFKENYKFNSKKYFWSKEELQRLTIKKNTDLFISNNALLNKLYDNEFFKELSKLHQEKLLTFSELFKSYEKIALVHTSLAQRSLDLSNKNNEELQKKLDEFKNRIEKSVNDFSKIKDELENKLLDFKDAYLEEKHEFKIVDELKADIENLSKEANQVLDKLHNA